MHHANNKSGIKEVRVIKLRPVKPIIPLDSVFPISSSFHPWTEREAGEDSNKEAQWLSTLEF
jgi:hypothetical protein